jgi:hypothetical protein
VVVANRFKVVVMGFVKLAKMRIARLVPAIAHVPWGMFALKVRAARRNAMARSVVQTVVVALAAIVGPVTAGKICALTRVPIVWK